MIHTIESKLLPCQNGDLLAVATLNKPQALNAIDLEMVDGLMAKLEAWQDDDNIALVVLDSTGDKAFCAGGDVVSMHNAMASAAEQKQIQPIDSDAELISTVPESLADFFTREYQLDYLIHTYRKPIVVWGHGIIMGGGLGLLSGASHRVVTQSSRIAMPEVSIGLYPDVGGSWFLNRMPVGCGLFLGLTGANISGVDAKYVGLADHLVLHEQKQQVIDALQSAAWHTSDALNMQLVTQILSEFDYRDEQLPANVEKHQPMLTALAQHTDAESYVKTFLDMDVSADPWLVKAQQSLAYGSPITIKLVFEQLAKAQDLSLPDCFKMELNMSCRCGMFGEFLEGVRALLVDKDRQPRWRYKQVSDVPDTVIQRFFTSPWQDHHPLAELGADESATEIEKE